MKIYNKLVRDKIPELIESDGRKCVTHILSEKEYIAALETKLDEEVEEYQVDKNLEEMADVLEALRAICIARGYTLEELEQLRAKKAAERLYEPNAGQPTGMAERERKPLCADFCDGGRKERTY
jgi:predicted house-cleaning noncanonical NTP pyrophosphatase (MazG superfamily)